MKNLRTRIAPVVGFVSAAVATACIVQGQPTHPQPAPAQGPYQAQPGQDPQGEAAPAVAASHELRDGEYFCSFTVGQYSYPNFPCVVYRRRDGRQVLEKLSGSQRIHGVVQPAAGGFDFRGTFFCPWGSCTEEVSARFTASQSPDIYEGTLFKNNGANQILVRLRYLPSGFPRGYGGYGRGYGYGRARSYGRSRR